MIARLRHRHRRVWVVAAVVIAATIALALGLRPEEAVDDAGLDHLRSTWAEDAP